MTFFLTVDTSPVGDDGLRFTTVQSPALGRRADVTIWAPPEAEGPLPLITLLHGVYGSHWGWAFHARAHDTARRLIDAGALPAVALAMPSDGLWGHGSAYVPHDDADYERWIVEEVPDVVATAGIAVAEGRGGIVGLSMGGFGAVRLAMRHPDRFAAAVGMSSITRFATMATFVGDLDRYPVPDDPDLAPLVIGTSARPALALDCGSDDLLIEENRALHAALVDAGVDHVYEEHPGGHDWTYWAAHIGAALTFVGRHLEDRP